VTDAQILQAFYDHWHLREENRQRIRLNAPTRTRYWRAWT
jgi:hypothetical protein